jgi:hypothetical protein
MTKIFWWKRYVKRWWTTYWISRKEGLMRKIVLSILILVLLASVPLDKWRQIPDQTEFLRLLGVVYCEQAECKKSLVGVMEVGENALFFADCLPEQTDL